MAEYQPNRRIDAGVKRGPRKTPSNARALRGLPPKPRLDDLGSWQIPATLNPDEVIDRYLTEATTSQIAASYGLSRRALTKWLRETRPDAWREAQLIRAHAKLEQAEDEMEVAPDPLSLARNDRVSKAMQFRLTALDRDYRPKQEVTITDNTDLGERLRRARERVIDAEVIRVEGAPTDADATAKTDGNDRG